jgi:hypothetical protein
MVMSSIFFWCLLVVLVLTVEGLRREDGQFQYIPDYSENYNYVHLSDKMRESLSISRCTMGGAFVDGERNADDEYDITVKIVPPPDIVQRKWSASNPAIRKKRIFSQVNSHLCASPRYTDVVKGIYKRAKGCYKVYVYDKKTGRKVKRFNDYGATLHPEHTRCQNDVFQSVCDPHSLTSTGLQLVESKFRALYGFPFVVTAKNAIVGRGGMFALPCGPFGLFSSCEAVKWGVPFAVNEVKNVSVCRSNPKLCPYPVYDKVFVLTQYDDTQIGQFMQENLPKLIYHLRYLKRNKDVKIHFGFTKQPTLPPFVLPHHFFASFGLLDRLINGTVYAKEVIMPREGGCQDIGYNAWEALSLRESFYDMLGIHEKIDFSHHRDSILHPANLQIQESNTDGSSIVGAVVKSISKPVLLLLTRSAGKFTQNKSDVETRRWSKEQLKRLIPALEESFPNHRVEIFSDVNSTLMQCPLCQAEKFARADIVIGHHGAGLSNTIFMRPGGVLVEVVYNFDSRHAPILGIFPRIADIVGLHHFTYYIKNIQPSFDMITFVNETAAFVKKAKLFAEM